MENLSKFSLREEFDRIGVSLMVVSASEEGNVSVRGGGEDMIVAPKFARSRFVSWSNLVFERMDFRCGDFCWNRIDGNEGDAIAVMSRHIGIIKGLLHLSLYLSKKMDEKLVFFINKKTLFIEFTV